MLVYQRVAKLVNGLTVTKIFGPVISYGEVQVTVKACEAHLATRTRWFFCGGFASQPCWICRG